MFFGLWRWRDKIRETTREEERRKQLEGLIDAVVALRSGCVEASREARVIRTPSEQQFVSQIGYALVGIESQIHRMLGRTPIATPAPPSHHPEATD